MSYQIASSIPDPTTGLVLKGLIFRLLSYNCDRVHQVLNAQVGIFADLAAANAGLAPVATYTYTFMTGGPAGATVAPLFAEVTTQAAITPALADVPAAAIYTSLLSHPSAAALLAGATVPDSIDI